MTSFYFAFCHLSPTRGRGLDLDLDLSYACSRLLGSALTPAPGLSCPPLSLLCRPLGWAAGTPSLRPCSGPLPWTPARVTGARPQSHRPLPPAAQGDSSTDAAPHLPPQHQSLLTPKPPHQNAARQAGRRSVCGMGWAIARPPRPGNQCREGPGNTSTAKAAKAPRQAAHRAQKQPPRPVGAHGPRLTASAGRGRCGRPGPATALCHT